MNDASETPHLFVSYSRTNSAYVYAVVQCLKQRRVSCFLDTEAEDMVGKIFLNVLHAGLKKARKVAVFIGPGGLGKFQRLEVSSAIANSLERGHSVIPVLIPGAGEITELELFLECFDSIDLRSVPEHDMQSSIARTQLDKLARICLADATDHRSSSARETDLSLAGILKSATRRVVISGHTLDRFSRDAGVKEALYGLVQRGIPITVLQLNPACAYADAHRPFHELESTSSSSDQHEHTEKFFRAIYADGEAGCSKLDVSYTPYMPRFRTVIIDDDVYAYLYMYASEVSDFPDLHFDPNNRGTDRTRRKILRATLSQIYAAETVPFIRCGQIFPNWRRNHVANWHHWTPERRRTHKLTHEFYVNNAQAFNERHGEWLEDDVKKHLAQTFGRTLVLGCGSGKEVLYIQQERSRDEVIGIDFSHRAVDLARNRCRSTSARIYLFDFYDLTHPDFLPGESFDSVVANAAFVHLQTRDDIGHLLRNIYSRMHSKGVLFLRGLYKETRDGPLDEEIEQPQSSLGGWALSRWFVYYSRTELVQRCREAGFLVDDRITKEIAKAFEVKVDTAMRKGFRHASFPHVYWSTVLARKAS